MSGRGQLREHSSLTRSLILAVVAGIQLARRETLGGFQCLAIREFNYANHGQLNDSSNNRLSAERCLFIDKTCLLWHLVVFTDRYGNRAITCLSDVPPRESSQKKQKKTSGPTVGLLSSQTLPAPSGTETHERFFISQLWTFVVVMPGVAL